MRLCYLGLVFSKFKERREDLGTRHFPYLHGFGRDFSHLNLKSDVCDSPHVCSQVHIYKSQAAALAANAAKGVKVVVVANPGDLLN